MIICGLFGTLSLLQWAHCGLANVGYIHRFIPIRKQYVFVNVSQSRQLAQFHDQPLKLDPDDVRAPFPAAFWVHEQVAWGTNFNAGPILISQSPHSQNHQYRVPAEAINQVYKMEQKEDIDDNTSESSGTATSGNEYPMDHEGEHSPMSFMPAAASVPIPPPLKDQPMYSPDTSSLGLGAYPYASISGSTLSLGSYIPNPVRSSNMPRTRSTPTTTATNSTLGSSPSQLSRSSEPPLDPRRGRGPNHNHDCHNHDYHSHDCHRRLHPSVMKQLDPWAPETRNLFGRENMLEIGFRSWFACEAENREEGGTEVQWNSVPTWQPVDVRAWLRGIEE